MSKPADMRFRNCLSFEGSYTVARSGNTYRVPLAASPKIEVIEKVESCIIAIRNDLEAVLTIARGCEKQKQLGFSPCISSCLPCYATCPACERRQCKDGQLMHPMARPVLVNIWPSGTNIQCPFDTQGTGRDHNAVGTLNCCPRGAMVTWLLITVESRRCGWQKCDVLHTKSMPILQTRRGRK